MTDTMVTGRMSQQKKKEGTRALKELGLNTSQAINQLFDYLISTGEMPFQREEKRTITKKDLQRAHDFLSSMQRVNSFSHMTDADIKKCKARAMGYDIDHQDEQVA